MYSVAIVTVTYNAEQHIVKTLESVLKQDYEMFEYIIMDGKSTDQTLEIIDRYKEAFCRKNICFHVASQVDEGIFDAMNNSLFFVNSDYVLFLNAGDFFVSETTLSEVFCASIGTDADIIYGNFYAYSRNMRKLILSDAAQCLPEKMPCTHQAIFTKTNLLKKYLYNKQYKMAADYDFYLKMYQDGKEFLKVDVPIVYFDIMGVSQSKAKITQKERFTIQYRHGCIEKDEYERRLKKIKYICLRKMIINYLPDIIRYKSYEKYPI